MIASDLHILLHALSPIDIRESLERPALLMSAATRFDPTTASEPKKDSNPEAQDCSASIAHLDGGEPRTGINFVPVFGELVGALVSYEGHGQYIAQECDYDYGRPTCCAHSVLQCLRDLQSLLEDEHIRDARRRDAEFTARLSRAIP